MSGGTLILSPHSDDAALSVGGCIALARLPMPLTLVTVFGQSNYMRGGFHADARAVTAVRRQEDASFAASAGVPLIYLELEEASLRPLPQGNRIFGDAGTNQEVPAEVKDALFEVIRTTQPSLVLAPLGLGDHRDHLLLARLGREWRPGAGDSEFTVAFYEDLPYAAALPYRTIRRVARQLTGRDSPEVVDIGQGLDAKLAGLRFYPSQLGPADAQAVVRHASRTPRRRSLWSWRQSNPGRRPSERLWSPKALHLGSAA